MISRIWDKRDAVVLTLLTVWVVYVAAIGSQYWLYTMSQVGIYAVVAIGFNLALGQAGQVTFAQVAFMAVGAYTTGILTTRHHWNPIAALVVSIALGALLSAIVNLPFLRLRGHYLGMATLAFALGVQSFARNATGLTNGAIGLAAIPPLGAGSVSLGTQPWFLITVWVLAAGCLLVYYLVTTSHLGRSFRAVAARPDVAAALGVTVARRRLLALVIAGSMAALAGSLYAEFINYVSPDFFNIALIGNIFFMVIVGGLGSTTGPLVGALVIVLLPNEISGLGSYSGVTVLGILLAALVLLPAGLLGDHGSVNSIRSLLPARAQAALSARGAR